MYYPPAKFGDDMSSGFCFRVLTYAHTQIHTHTYRADKHPTPATTSVWVKKNELVPWRFIMLKTWLKEILLRVDNNCLSVRHWGRYNAVRTTVSMLKVRKVKDVKERRNLTYSLLKTYANFQIFCVGSKHWANVLWSQTLRPLWHRTVVPSGVTLLLYFTWSERQLFPQMQRLENACPLCLIIL